MNFSSFYFRLGLFLINVCIMYYNIDLLKWIIICMDLVKYVLKYRD